MSTPSTDADTPTLKREDVWSYPRPPALEPVPQRLRIVWYPEAPEPLDELEKANKAGEPVTIADTTAGYRVLETSHPPTYYLPPDDVRIDLLSRSNQRQTMCEWKGRATYFDFHPPSGSVVAQESSSSRTSRSAVSKGRIWTYESPTTRFQPIAGYLSFYASAGLARGQGEWKCYVGDEQVQAQEGNFYGGWVTSNLFASKQNGRMKGGPGSWGW